MVHRIIIIEEEYGNKTAVLLRDVHDLTGGEEMDPTLPSCYTCFSSNICIDLTLLLHLSLGQDFL